VNKFKKGDTVIVIKGRDTGKKGKILKVEASNQTMIVEKVNIVKKHQKATDKVQAGIVDKLLPIQWSKVMLVCPVTNKHTRVGFVLIEGKKKRKCKASGEVID